MYQHGHVLTAYTNLLLLTLTCSCFQQTDQDVESIKLGSIMKRGIAKFVPFIKFSTIVGINLDPVPNCFSLVASCSLLLGNNYI